MNNLRISLFSAIIALTSISAIGQTSLNITEIGRLQYTQELSEVRGAVHNGREYALVGVFNGFSIVDLIDPANPTEVFFEPGPTSIWRDPFYHNGYAYCVNESGGGLLIVDMSPLPGNTNLPTSLYTGTQYPWTKAHNMFIDTIAEKAYIFGSDNPNGHDGAIILDISDPANPVDLGVWSDHYIHDGFVRGDTLWASCLEAGTFVVDVSNPTNPIVLTSWDTPSQFGHNVWPSDDNAYCYTTDEVESGFVTAYDMSDYSNIVEVDRVRHPLTENVIPHNTHFFDDYIITSHYRDGLTIHDVTDPANIVLTGYYDSSPLSGGGFNGSWGAWPYLPSGILLNADIEEGLFIFDADYTRAARLEGVVTEAGSGNPINDVQVEVLSTTLIDNTTLFGNYALGTATAGTYTVSFLKGGFIPDTVTGVELVNGQVTTLDVELIPEQSFVFTGIVSDEGTGNPIEGAVVQIQNDLFDYSLVTDADGKYVDSTFFAGDYNINVGLWGYVTECTSASVTGASNAPNFELQKGYSDDFSMDLGWEVSGNAQVGIWERATPIGTPFEGGFSNPDSDAGSTCGTEAYITGNNPGAGVGSNDVDEGETILTSPVMDLTNFTLVPFVVFRYWFFNGGGDGNPNDELLVKLDDGSEITNLVSLQRTNGVNWGSAELPLADYANSTSVRIILETNDILPGHLVECGIDDFEILNVGGIRDNQTNFGINLYPNPSNGDVNVFVPSSVDNLQLRVYDAVGALVMEDSNLTTGTNTVTLNGVPGVYICEFISNGERQVQRLLIN